VTYSEACWEAAQWQAIAKDRATLLDAASVELNRQSKMLALALKEKNDAISGNGIKELQQQVINLQAELQLLKPPEPKFKIKQIVMAPHAAQAGRMWPMTVRQREYRAADKSWYYSNFIDDEKMPEYIRARELARSYRKEADIRALNAEEIG
jgi:hypothetical protein